MKIQDFFKGINNTFSPADERELQSLDDATRKWFNDPDEQPEWYKKTIGKYQDTWWFRQLLMFIYLFTIPYINNLLYGNKEKDESIDPNKF